MDADTTAQVPYIVTEFIDGPTLSQEIQLRGPLTRSELHQLAVNLASAIMAFHRVGIVHRDVKPSNIILSRTGPRIIDLGISRAMDEVMGITVTDGQQPGTPQLMAPEQWTGGRPTTATDVFAWGGVVAHAATGRFPFTGSDPRELKDAVLHDPPALDGLDDGLHPLIARALAKEPAARPPITGLLAQLLGATPGSLGEATPSGGTTARGRRDAVHERSIAGVLRTTGRLTPAEVTAVGLALSRQLDETHAHGASHGLIDPSSVLISDEGTAFLDGPTADQDADAPLADGPTLVHRPPEVLDGHPTGSPADVYSLGSTLYTCLAGKAPFEARPGEGPASVIRRILDGDSAHLDRDDVPGELRTVITAMMAVEPSHRPSAARLVGEFTNLAESIGLTPPRSSAAPSPETSPTGPSDLTVCLDDVSTMTTSTPELPASKHVETPTRRSRPRRRALIGLAGAIVAAIVATTVVLVVTRPPSPPATATVPGILRGLPAAEAESAVRTAGFLDIRLHHAVNAAAQGTVTAVDPAGGTSTRLDAVITLTVSDGPEPVLVPNVVGKAQGDAEAELSALGLGVTVETDSGTAVTAAPGHVERQSNIDERVPPGTLVTLTVVSPQLLVPDLVGTAAGTASDQLSAAGFQVTRENQQSSSPVGTVIGQDPRGIPADRGSAVHLTVSAGRPVPTPRTSTPRTPRPTPTPAGQSLPTEGTRPGTGPQPPPSLFG